MAIINLEPTATLAAAARVRRDIVSGVAMDEASLIRFVENPSGGVTPDLARKLPGRGIWVASNRASVDLAAQRNLFSRAAKKKLDVGPELSTRVVDLMVTRLLASLGLARKSGEAITGFEKSRGAIVSNAAAFLIEASDGAADGRRKMLDLIRRTASPPRLIGLFRSEDLALAMGSENVVHSVFLAGRGAERWAIEVERFAGFRPLFPESWDP